MISLLDLLATLALIVAALAVMTGMLPPAEAFRRVATALVLLLVVPTIFGSFIHSAITGPLAAAVTDLRSPAHILVTVAVLALVGWLVVQQLHRWSSRTGKSHEEGQ